MAEIYCGEYTTSAGQKIPYVMTIGEANLCWIKYDLGDGQREKVIKAEVDEQSEYSWKIKRRTLYYKSPKQLLRLFNEFDAYANMTFRKFTGIE